MYFSSRWHVSFTSVKCRLLIRPRCQALPLTWRPSYHVLMWLFTSVLVINPALLPGIYPHTTITSICDGRLVSLYCFPIRQASKCGKSGKSNSLSGCVPELVTFTVARSDKLCWFFYTQPMCSNVYVAVIFLCDAIQNKRVVTFEKSVAIGEYNIRLNSVAT